MSPTRNNVVHLASYIRLRAAAASRTSLEPAENPASQVPEEARAFGARGRRRAESSDDDLAQRLVFGDVEAAESLRDRYFGRLVAVAQAVLGDETEAEIIADAALEEACRGWPPERGQVSRWLVRLARRAAIKRRRALTGFDAPVHRAGGRARTRRSRSFDSQSGQ